MLTPTTQLSATSLQQQILKYLEIDAKIEDDGFDCLVFWQQHRLQFDKLYHPAIRALSVPASSAPIERVFSQGGLIMRPHRARLSDAKLSSLIFLKCNSSM